MKKILFPTDFSTAAENAFSYAISLAEEIDAKIDVVHIYHLPFVDATNVPPEYIEEMLAEKQNVVRAKLREFTEKHPSDRIDREMTVYGLFIPQEIKDLIEDNDYDLVVMGTKGEHHSQIEKIMGSVTTHTMMQAPCPVLAVPFDASWKDIRRIAYATNFEPKDTKAAGQLMNFASALAAEVHFVHIETSPAIGKMEDYISLANYPYTFTDFAIVNSPSVIEGVEHYVKDRKIDLLALFIPERRLWEKLFHNSFTKKMAFHSKMPILVFHE